jgi:hypothetical protein
MTQQNPTIMLWVGVVSNKYGANTYDTPRKTHLL